MGRKKILDKNVNVSISITKEQYDFIRRHPKFSLSSFVQNHLHEYYNIVEEYERIERGLLKDV